MITKSTKAKLAAAQAKYYLIVESVLDDNESFMDDYDPDTASDEDTKIYDYLMSLQEVKDCIDRFDSL